jgi:hypothetical protein
MIIGISGQAGSGKDTVADRLCKDHGFVKVAFSDPMKRICREVYDFTDEQLWGPSENRNAEDKRYPRCTADHAHSDACIEYLTPRLALQTLGTEWGRFCYPNTWVDHAIRVHEKLQSGGYAYDQKRGLYSVSTLEKVQDRMMWPKTNVVISDVRFKNEVDGIRKAGGQIWRIHRPSADGSVGIKGHASEEEQKSIPVDAFNVHVFNNAGLEELYELVDAHARALLGK